MKPPAELDLASARDLVKVGDWQKTNRAFYEGDHWQKGDGWGPKPDQTTAEGRDAFTLLERIFVSQNMVAEVSDTHVDGVWSRPVAWSWETRNLTFLQRVRRSLSDLGRTALRLLRGQPADVAGPPPRRVEGGRTTDEKPRDRATEVDALLLEWWERKHLARKLKDATTRAVVEGRQALYLFIPTGRLGADGRVHPTNIREALDLIELRVVPVEKGTVVEDADSLEGVGVYLYTLDGVDHAQLTYVSRGGDGRPPAGHTVLRTAAAGGDQGEPIHYDLGGRLLMHEMSRTPLISPQVRQNQRALNVASTVESQIVIGAGFPERVLLDVQVNGRYEEEPDGKGGTRKKFIPDPMRFGPRITNALQSSTTKDEDGRTVPKSGKYLRLDPVSIETASEAVKSRRRAILQEARQLHTEIEGDSTATGVARQQARVGFLGSLTPTREMVREAVVWSLETALALAEALVDQPGKYTKELRAVAVVKADAGPVPLEDQRKIADLVDSGHRSLEWGLSESGIDDVDAEVERNLSQRHLVPALRVKQAEVFSHLGGQGGTTAAAVLAGYDVDEAKLLAAVDPADVVEP